MDTIQYIKDIIQALGKELLRYRVLVACLFSIVLGCIMVLAIHWPKYYVSTAVIVKDITNVIAPLLKDAAQMVDVDKNESVRQLILSRKLLNRVLDRVYPEFPSLSPEEQAKLYSEVRSNISISTRLNSTKVSFRSKTPEDAYQKLTAIVDVFLSDRIANKQEKGHEAHNFIASQANTYREKLLEAERNLKVFRSKSVDLTESGVKARISSLSVELQELLITIDELAQMDETLNQQLRDEGESISARNKVSQMESRRAVMSDQLDSLRLIYQDNYPDIVTLKDQIAGLDEALRGARSNGWIQGEGSDLPLIEEIRKQLSATIVEREAKKRRVTALKNLLQSEQAIADEISNNQAEFVELTRDYNVTRKIYEDMLARKESASITLDLNDEGQGASFRLVDPPRYPLSPDGIRALFIYLVAPFIAFGVPIGLAAALVLLDPRIRSISILESKLPDDVLLLVDIPHRSTPLGSKLLRKDVFALFLFAVALMVGYVYILFLYKDIL